MARARVVSGAAVQSDSLQLVLELNEARVSLLRAESAVRSARLGLGRLVGRRGAVDAVPLDTADVPDLPVTLPDAVTLALEQGPEWRVARANETQATPEYLDFVRTAVATMVDVTGLVIYFTVAIVVLGGTLL